MNGAKQAELQVAFLPDMAVQEPERAEPIDRPLLTPTIEPVPPRYYTVAKRAADLIVSSILLVLSAPLLFLIALIIRRDSPGPALFVQMWVGRNGELFDIYKFRSMHADAPRYECSPTSSWDPRITPGSGRFPQADQSGRAAATDERVARRYVAGGTAARDALSCAAI